MLLKIILQTIPKSVNEIIFILGLLGLFVILKKKNQKKYIYLCVLAVVFMISWRCCLQIKSSRYASGLIIPFVLTTAFLLNSFLFSKKNSLRSFFILLVGAIVVIWGEKNYDIRQINSNLMVISNVHERFCDSGAEHILITYKDDAARILFYENKKNPLQQYYYPHGVDDVYSYSDKYKAVYTSTLYDIILKGKEPTKINSDNYNISLKEILSIYTQANKKKKHCIYLIRSKMTCRVISNNKAIKPECGILKNGDLEIIDNPQQSFSKVSNRIGRYSQYFEYNPSIRTPYNAYFHNSEDITPFLPYYNCSEVDPISGQYSATIRINAQYGVGYILFEQRFHNGKYEYSLLIKGKKGTKVCLLYDVLKNKEWNVTPLAIFTIPDKRIYQIKTQFDINDLSPDDFFIVGAWVQNGESQLDNFVLKEQ